MEVRTIPFKQIKRDERCQSRSKFDEEYVVELLNVLQDGREFFGPPPVVFFDGETYWLADGFNRMEAHRRHGSKSVQVDVREGGFIEAETYAHREANAHHGKRLSPGDQSNKVAWHLSHEKWKHFTDSTIAAWCHCARSLVFQVREKSASAGTSKAVPEWLDYPQRTQWEMIVEKGGTPQLHYDPDGNLTVKAKQKPKTKNASASAGTLENVPVDEIRKQIAKLNKQKMPEKRANRHIAEAFKTTPEIVAKIRAGEDFEPPVEENPPFEETPTEEATETNPQPEPKSDQPKLVRVVGNKGENRLGDTFMADWANRIRTLPEAFNSIETWNERNKIDFPRAEMDEIAAKLLAYFTKNQPEEICPECGGEGCVSCLGMGVVPRWAIEEMEAKG